MEAVWKSGSVPPSFFTLLLDGCDNSASLPGLFTPGKEPPLHILDSRACLDAVK
jgi:hypothetical protein